MRDIDGGGGGRGVIGVVSRSREFKINLLSSNTKHTRACYWSDGQWCLLKFMLDGWLHFKSGVHSNTSIDCVLI